MSAISKKHLKSHNSENNTACKDEQIRKIILAQVTTVCIWPKISGLLYTTSPNRKNFVKADSRHKFWKTACVALPSTAQGTTAKFRPNTLFYIFPNYYRWYEPYIKSVSRNACHCMYGSLFLAFAINF